MVDKNGGNLTISDKLIIGSYDDLYLGVTFLEHTVWKMLIFRPIVHNFVRLCGNAGEVRWKIILQICALIIYDCNGESMPRVSQ